MSGYSALNDIDRVDVLCSNNLVGTIAMTRAGCMAFEYSDEWIDGGFSISPLSLPLQKGVFVAKHQPLDGLFGIFADSLPDGWGRLLVDRALSSRGIDPRSLNPLARLSIVGASGMGALEYVPASPLPLEAGDVDLDRLASECSKILESEYSDDLDELFALGGSSGGARPKILTQVDDEDWIIKFPSSVDSSDIGKDEYELARLAKQCGVTMPEVRLFPSKRCAGYFGVKRFDRISQNGAIKKIHMASAAALLETSHRIPNLDYETLFRLVAAISGSMRDAEQLYRLMCFNVFIGNRDDHSKNFSFLYDEGEGWSLSPAYDLTVNVGMYGQHATTVNGKGRNIGISDLMEVGSLAGIAQAKAKSIANEIHDTVSAANRLVIF